jgi:hypothetical protein
MAAPTPDLSMFVHVVNPNGVHGAASRMGIPPSEPRKYKIDRIALESFHEKYHSASHRIHPTFR